MVQGYETAVTWGPSAQAAGPFLCERAVLALHKPHKNSLSPVSGERVKVRGFKEQGRHPRGRRQRALMESCGSSCGGWMTGSIRAA